MSSQKECLCVSACLAGEKCRYDGKTAPDKQIIEYVKNGEAISLCPEVLGGLETPRVPCEIIGGDGFDVLDGKAKVIDKNGEDKTNQFLIGALMMLDICKNKGITKAILKSRSPSCGFSSIYDGSFSGKIKEGYGVSAALLIKNGIDVEEI